MTFLLVEIWAMLIDIDIQLSLTTLSRIYCGQLFGDLISFLPCYRNPGTDRRAPDCAR